MNAVTREMRNLTDAPTVTFVLNGREITAPVNETLIEIADRLCLHARLVAQTRYFDAETIGDLDERFIDRGGNFAAIEHERNGGSIVEVAHLAGDGVHGVL